MKKTLNYVCPKCHRLVTLDLRYAWRVQIPETEAPGTEVVTSWNPGDNVTVACPDCGVYMFPVDAAIGELIRDFNALGWSTLFSCQGHYEHMIWLENDPAIRESWTITEPYAMFGPYEEAKANHLFLRATQLRAGKYPFLSVQPVDPKQMEITLWNRHHLRRESLHGVALYLSRPDVDASDNAYDNKIGPRKARILTRQFVRLLTDLRDVLAHEANP